MQRLDLNLASNPFRNNTLLWVSYGTAAVLLLLFTSWNVNTFVDYRARLLDLRDTVGTFQTQRLELETRGKRALDGIRRFDVKSLQIKTDKANEVIEWKAFSWTRLFNTLERVLPYQVRMNSVRPIFNPTGGRQDQRDFQVGEMPVAIEGTARSFDDLAELQRAFHADANIGRVEPERLDKTDSGEFVFRMRFMYLPGEDAQDPAEPTPEEATAEEVAGPVSAEPDLVGEGEPGSEDVPQPPGVDETAGTEQDPAAVAEPAQVEVLDPGPTGEIEIDREAVGTPASKAKRSAGPRTRSDPRRRRPASRDGDEEQEKEEDPP